MESYRGLHILVEFQFEHQILGAYQDVFWLVMAHFFVLFLPRIGGSSAGEADGLCPGSRFGVVSL